eukprot:3628912-Pleurochrysis_carterae.AAC.2
MRFIRVSSFMLSRRFWIFYIFYVNTLHILHILREQSTYSAWTVNIDIFYAIWVNNPDSGGWSMFLCLRGCAGACVHAVRALADAQAHVRTAAEEAMASAEGGQPEMDARTHD